MGVVQGEVEGREQIECQGMFSRPAKAEPAIARARTEV